MSDDFGYLFGDCGATTATFDCDPPWEQQNWSAGRSARRAQRGPKWDSNTEDQSLFDAFRGIDSESAWADADRRLLEFRNLGDDWDGDGAVGPDKMLVDSARALLASLRNSGTTVPSRIVPTVNGTVSFEWYAGDAMTQLEVIDIGLAEQMVFDPTQSTTSSFVTW